MHKYAVRLLKNKLFPLNVADNMELRLGQAVVVRTDKGEELANVEKISCCTRKMWANEKVEAVAILRIASHNDIERDKENENLQKVALAECKALIKNHKLDMNLVMADYTLDRRKLTFYYTANGRVDFRALLRDLTQVFKHTRIDLRHIGVRDETALKQGVGPCGRTYCCCSWLKKFNSINSKLVKDQGLPATPSKISGACGRLLCCLNYEYKNYIDAAKGLPPVGSGVITPDGVGRVSALHFLNGMVQVKLEDGKTKEFTGKDIEMIDAEIKSIDIKPKVEYTEEDSQDVDIKSLEDE